MLEQRQREDKQDEDQSQHDKRPHPLRVLPEMRKDGETRSNHKEDTNQ